MPLNISCRKFQEKETKALASSFLYRWVPVHMPTFNVEEYKAKKYRILQTIYVLSALMKSFIQGEARNGNHTTKGTNHFPEALRDGEAEVSGCDLTRVADAALEYLRVLEELLLVILQSMTFTYNIFSVQNF